MNGDDITRSNKSMPQFPNGMPLWQRVLCVLGYHKRETRQTAIGHCYGFQTEEGERRGIFGIHDENRSPLRDQCGRCDALLSYAPPKAKDPRSCWSVRCQLGKRCYKGTCASQARR